MDRLPYMTFIISPQGVNNTLGTTAKFNPGGSIKVGGNFQNSGTVEIDVRANLDILGNVLNSGNFNIKDYVTEAQYQIIESAINDLNGEAKEFLQQSYNALKGEDVEKANSWFGKFIGYIKEHPELITSSVQILLQLFSKAPAPLA